MRVKNIKPLLDECGHTIPAIEHRSIGNALTLHGFGKDAYAFHVTPKGKSLRTGQLISVTGLLIQPNLLVLEGLLIVNGKPIRQAWECELVEEARSP